MSAKSRRLPINIFSSKTTTSWKNRQRAPVGFVSSWRVGSILQSYIRSESFAKYDNHDSGKAACTVLESVPPEDTATGRPATACVGTGRSYDRNHGSPIAIHRSLKRQAPSLLRPQCDHRVDSRCAARRNKARQCRNEGQQPCHGEINGWL